MYCRFSVDDSSCLPVRLSILLKDVRTVPLDQTMPVQNLTLQKCTCHSSISFANFCSPFLTKAQGMPKDLRSVWTAKHLGFVCADKRLAAPWLWNRHLRTSHTPYRCRSFKKDNCRRRYACVCVSGHVWAYLGVVPGKLQDNFATCWGGEKPEEAVLLCFQLIYPMSMPHFWRDPTPDRSHL